MRTILTVLVAAILLGSASEQPETSGPTPAAAPSDRREASEAPVVAPPLSPEQREIVDWATDRFAEAGLELPEFTIHFDATQDACNGEDGIYDDVDGHHTVAVCQPMGSGAGSILELRRTTLHELAHVWEAEYLSDAERDDALATVDAARWIHADDAWEHRGIERFAETLVFGLYGQKHRPMLIDTPCAEIYADFVEITGVEPVGPVGSSCLPEPDELQ